MDLRFNDALTEAVEAATFTKHAEQFALFDSQMDKFTASLNALETRGLALAAARDAATDATHQATLDAEMAQVHAEMDKLGQEIKQRKEAAEVCIVRDVYGRLRFAINLEEKDYPRKLKQQLEAALDDLGKFATTRTVLFRDDLSNPDKFFKHHREWHQTAIPYNFENGKPSSYWRAKVMDRQIIGQDWLQTPPTKHKARPLRLVFYGLKGGVGRTTALAMTALALAKAGKRVLVLDFDLESPGLASMLLPPEHSAKLGLVDWFVEEALETVDERFLQDMLVPSPVFNAQQEGFPEQTNMPGIWLAPAMGSNETDYIAKLARVYTDIPAKKAGDPAQSFASRMRNLVERLERQAKADVVLLDSRAGFHDVAAIAMTSLADKTLLFGTNARQTWDGYQQLFLHWAQRPQIGQQMRQRIRMVQALAPAHDRELSIAAYRQNAYQVFSSTLYDSDPKSDATEGADIALPAVALYQPHIDDESAPHFPLRIEWNAQLQEYAPLKRESEGGISFENIQIIYGPMQRWAISQLERHVAQQAAAKQALHGQSKAQAQVAGGQA